MIWSLVASPRLMVVLPCCAVVVAGFLVPPAQPAKAKIKAKKARNTNRFIYIPPRAVGSTRSWTIKSQTAPIVIEDWMSRWGTASYVVSTCTGQIYLARRVPASHLYLLVKRLLLDGLI